MCIGSRMKLAYDFSFTEDCLTPMNVSSWIFWSRCCVNIGAQVHSIYSLKVGDIDVVEADGKPRQVMWGLLKG